MRERHLLVFHPLAPDLVILGKFGLELTFHVAQALMILGLVGFLCMRAIRTSLLIHLRFLLGRHRLLQSLTFQALGKLLGNGA